MVVNLDIINHRFLQADSQNNTQQPGKSLSLLSLFLALLCPLSVVCLSYYLKLNIESKILISVARTIIQLLLAGYVLLGFIFSMRNPIYVVGYLLLMVGIAAIEVKSRQIRTYAGHFADSCISVLVGGALVGAYGSIIVFNPSPWWEPHVMVPTAGMIIGNAVSGPALAVERLLAEISEKRHEPETRLCFGATQFEAVLPTIRAATSAALMQNLNQMAVVGLVSIPGMMTGQLLGGASPLVAAEYQMAILWLIFATAAFSTLSAMGLAIPHAIFDNEHRLTPHRIIKVAAKSSFEKVLMGSFMALANATYGLIKRVVLCQCGTVRGSSEYALVPLVPMDSQSEKAAAASESSPSGEAARRETVGLNAAGKVLVSLEANVPTDYVGVGLPVSSRDPPMFEVRGLNVLSGEEMLFPPEGLDFSLRRGEIMTVEGPSGLGKTRFLRALSQLDPPLRGEMKFVESEEAGVFNLLGNALIPNWRRRSIYVPQAVPPLAGSPKDLLKECCTFQSRAALTETKDVLTGGGACLALMLYHGIDAICTSTEEALGLTSGKLSDQWNSLSGGERQRAAIACALILAKTIPINGKNPRTAIGGLKSQPPCIILFDEPTAACDAATCVKVEKAIVESGVAAVMITHDDRQAIRIAHKRLRLGLRIQQSMQEVKDDDYDDVANRSHTEV